MKRKLTSRILVLALFVAGVSVFNSCKDYDDDMYSELRGELNQEASLREAIESQIKDLKAQIALITPCKCDPSKYLKNEDFQGKFDDAFATAIANYKVGDENLTVIINNFNEEIKNAQLAIGSNNVSIDSLATVTNNLNLAIIDAKNKAEEAYKLAEKANNLAVTDSVEIAGLKDVVKNLNNRVIGMGDSLRVAYDNASSAKTTADANAAWIEAFKNVYASKTDSIDNVTKGLQDSLNAVRDLANANYALAIHYTDSALAIVKQQLTEDMNTKVSDLTAGYQKADSLLQVQITELNEKVSALDVKINANTNSINKLSNALSKLVTGIIVQATENPVFGSFALPMDVRSNVLMSYYGSNQQSARDFPTLKTGTEASYDKNSFFTDGDWKMLQECGLKVESYKDGETFMSTDAGTIYMTVNPAGTNFEDLKVSLVNSQDKESGIKIGALKKSDKVLSFGYSRAANNGFYEAPATLDEANLSSVKINIEPGLKAQMTQALQDKGKNVDFTSLISKIYNQFNDVLDANALKASWTDSLGEHAVYSQYNVAATAFKPLSFKFMEGTSISLPIIHPLNDMSNFDIRNYFDTSVLKFNFKYDSEFNVNLGSQDFSVKLDSVKFAFDFKDLDLSDVNSDIHIKDTIEVEIPNVDNAYVGTDGKLQGVTTDKDTIYVDCVVTLQDFLNNLSDVLSAQIAKQMNLQINDMLNGQINKWNESLNAQLKEQMNNVMKDISGQIEKQVNDMVNDMLASINTELNDKIDTVLDQINNSIRNNAGSYIGKLNSYITRINNFSNRINALLKNPNDFLQVTMLYEGKDGSYHQLSNVKSIPTTFKVGTGNATMLLPTTYSAEIISPAYKKFIAVTNVYKDGESAQSGNAACLSALKTANGLSYINEVISGERLAIPFEATLTDAVYELTYSALDYNGTSSTRKFYVKVVK